MKTQVLPIELTRVLARDPAVMVGFKKLPPSTQQQYIDWISEAKRSATRLHRAEQTYAQLRENDPAGGAGQGTVIGKSLISKLGFKPGMQGRAVNAPFNYAQLLAGDTTNIRFFQEDHPEMDFVHVFCDSYASLQHALQVYPNMIKPKGMIWISWPKKSSGVASEIDENDIRALSLTIDWVDVKVVSVDATWSALQLRRRQTQPR